MRFRFRGTPNYQEWDNYLYNVPIVPQHVWKGYSDKVIVAATTTNIEKLSAPGRSSTAAA